jgi:hypothetical protein
MHEACDAFGRLNTCILDFSVAIDRGRFYFLKIDSSEPGSETFYYSVEQSANWEEARRRWTE